MAGKRGVPRKEQVRRYINPVEGREGGERDNGE